MSDLNSAIEDVYDAFADVERPTSIDGCVCCIDQQTLNKLCRVPLRQLSPDDLSTYASCAFLTVGDVSDYAYLLPRILEISATEKDWWPDIEITGRAIQDAQPADWPNKQWQALEFLFEEVVKKLVSTQEYFYLDDWLCGAARAGIDVKPLLKVMETDNRAVDRFLDDNPAARSQGELSNPFWELPNKGHDDIVEWLRSERISILTKRASIQPGNHEH